MSQNISTKTQQKAPAIEGFDRFSNLPYHSPSPGRLPMIAYLPNNPPLALDESMCENMEDCGINAAITSVSINKIKESMQRAANHNISSIVMHAHLLPDEIDPDNEVTKETRLGWCKDLINDLKDESGLGGYFQKRNPMPSLLPYLNPFIRKIEETACGPKPGDNKNYSSFKTPLIVTMLPERPPLGEMEKPEDQIIIPKFEKCEDGASHHYLPRVQQCLGPGVWFSNSDAWYKNSAGRPVPCYREYFNNLRIMEMMSVSTNRPFWSSVKCVDKSYIEPTEKNDNLTEGVMLFEAMSALAYGAQGLVFTEFRQPQTTGTGSNTSLIPTWDYVQPVIDRIRELEAVFLGAEVIETVHTGLIPVSPYYENSKETLPAIQKFLYSKMENPIGPLLNIQLSNCSHMGFIVSHLALMPENSMLGSSVHAGEALDFLVIVNQDLFWSQPMRLTLSPYYEVMEVSSAKINQVSPLLKNRNRLVEKKVQTDSENKVIFNLAPGDALVLRWK